MSSTHEATQQTLIEPATEEISSIERGYDEVVMMADVQWCLRSLMEPQQTELASQFTLDTTDGQKLIEQEHGSVQELVKPDVSQRAHMRVLQQTHRSAALVLARKM